jgi:glycosyltransferase involved in cell wall biosynthesis
MKICIFTETYTPVVGGGETQAQLLADSLIQDGHSAIILTRRSEKGFKKDELVGQVPVYRIPPPGKGQLKKWALIFTCIPALLRLRNHYDLLFVSGYRIVGISAILLCKLLRKKCILKADSQGEMSGEYFANGLEKSGLSLSFLPFKLFLKMRNFILKKADAFSAISEEMSAELIAAGVPASKVHPIPNSVDTRRYKPVDPEQKSLLRRKLSIPANFRVVIYTGRLVTYKGLPLMLEVWNELRKRHDNIYLLLLGTGGMDIHNCENQLHDFVKANGLENTVRFTGSVSNVPEYLQASDIFAFPTQDDAFPSSLVEAMACGLAVVTTPVGAIKTVIQDGENGILIQPGNHQLLYSSLELLISDPSWAGILGQAAVKTARTCYASDNVSKQYLSLFQHTAAVR